MGLWDEVENNEIDQEQKNLFQINSFQDCQQVIDSISNYEQSSEKKTELFEYFGNKIQINNYNGDNPYLKNPYKGMELLANLFAPQQSTSEFDGLYNEFCNCLDNDYMEFAAKDDFPDEAGLFDKLSVIREKIDEAIKFPELINKTTIAIGGGFSAGKSSFINAILNTDQDILPTDTRPTTSIPTYVVKRLKDNKITSYNIFGKKTEIDTAGLLAISHEFHSVYNLGLTTILKKNNLATKHMQYQNIAFLDTPGYSKSEIQRQGDNTDEAVAKKHLVGADYLIWVVDIEQGVIPKKDIDFIENMKFNQPILFIMNKADKKPEEDVEKIIAVVKKTLEKTSFNVVDVIAYSSHHKKEILSSKKLASFFEKANKPISRMHISKEIKEILTQYENYHDEKIAQKKSLLGIFNKIDTVAYKTINELPDFYDALDKIKSDLRERRSIQNSLFNLKQKMLDITDRIDAEFGSLQEGGQQSSLKRKGKQIFDSNKKGKLSLLLEERIEALRKVGKLPDGDSRKEIKRIEQKFMDSLIS